ncbi:MAG: hypothetical protein ACRDR6_04700 [Pseudonocardiaceae bacterium]
MPRHPPDVPVVIILPVPPDMLVVSAVEAGGVVLVVEKVTRDSGRHSIELVRVVETADRTTLVYDDLPIAPLAKNG